MGQVQEWSKTFEAVFSFNTLNRYDLPSEHQHPVGNPRGPKNKITVYPNFFHAIKTLTTFEYKDFPKTIKTKKNRVQKIRALAHDLHQVLCDFHREKAEKIYCKARNRALLSGSQQAARESSARSPAAPSSPDAQLFGHAFRVPRIAPKTMREEARCVTREVSLLA